MTQTKIALSPQFTTAQTYNAKGIQELPHTKMDKHKNGQTTKYKNGNTQEWTKLRMDKNKNG